MIIVSEGPLCLKIHLSKNELETYFVACNKIYLNSPKTKRIISFLFNTAITHIEFEKTGKKFLEIFPTLCGGCVLKFTSEPLPPINTKRIKKIKLTAKHYTKNKLSYVFVFDSFENILSVIKELGKTNKTKEYFCSLYSNKNRYFLNICIPVSDIKTALFINEFALYSVKGKHTKCLLKEYTKCLIKRNAIKILNYFFFK